MLSREQSRQFDQYVIQRLQVPGVVLMENAGRGCVDQLRDAVGGTWPLSKLRVVVLCGPGNNGGDGFVVARHLWNAGCRVKVVLSCAPDRFRNDAATMLAALVQLPIELVEYPGQLSDEAAGSILSHVGREPADWLVDALLGSGASGPLRPPIDRMVSQANALSARRMAVDIPSGLDCDSGQPQRVTFRADLTCSLIDTKVGFESPAAQAYLGQVQVVGIGVDRRAIPFGLWP